jgi:hypothetical protein
MAAGRYLLKDKEELRIHPVFYKPGGNTPVYTIGLVYACNDQCTGGDDATIFKDCPVEDRALGPDPAIAADPDTLMIYSLVPDRNIRI